ncbi:hypothetical protein KBD61_00025 [Patescibacteria group bacterium]|nr:hypothetical protein [Patescibacteria group bacterium]MBP9709396.1 hypothetical protein [Patescibacteria group bacterium]
MIVKSSTRVLPPGTHPVRVSSIDSVENMRDATKEQLEINLEAVGASYGEPPSVRFWTSPVLHPQGKLLPFIEAVAGRPLSSEELRNGFEVDSLIGQELLVVVKAATSQAGKTYSKVVDFLPKQN